MCGLTLARRTGARNEDDAAGWLIACTGLRPGVQTVIRPAQAGPWHA